MAVAMKTTLAAEKVSVAQSDASLSPKRTRFHNIPTKADSTTAAPSPETTSTPSVSVAKSDASTTDSSAGRGGGNPGDRPTGHERVAA